MNIVDIELNKDTNDLVFDGNDFVLVENKSAVKQQLLIELSTHTNEWYYNTDLGLPYIGNVLGNNVNGITVNSTIYNGITNINTVKKITSLSYDFDDFTRMLDVAFEVESIFGSFNFSLLGINL